MYIVKITNNTPLCKMVNFSRSVLKIYTGQKKFTRAAPVAPVTNIRYACVPISTWVLLLPGKQGDLPEDKIAKIWKDWFNNSSLDV